MSTSIATSDTVSASGASRTMRRVAGVRRAPDVRVRGIDGHRSWCLRVSRETVKRKKACERRACLGKLACDFSRSGGNPSTTSGTIPYPQGYADTKHPEGPLRVKGAAPGSESPPAAPKVNRTGPTSRRPTWWRARLSAHRVEWSPQPQRSRLRGGRSLRRRRFLRCAHAAALGCPPRVERPGARRPPGAGGRSCLLPGLLDRHRERLGIRDVDEIPDLDGA